MTANSLFLPVALRAERRWLTFKIISNIANLVSKMKIICRTHFIDSVNLPSSHSKVNCGS